MKNSKLLSYILPFVFSAFTGAVIWRQFTLFQYFYASKVDDFLLIILLLVSGIVVMQKYLRLSSVVALITSGTVLILGNVIYRISYDVFEHYDVLSLSTYMYCILVALSIASYQKQQSGRSLSLLMLFFFIFIGGLAQYLIKGSLLIGGLSIGFVLLSFIMTITQAEVVRWHKGYYGMLFLSLVLYIATLDLPPALYTSQTSYYDQVVYSHSTPFQTVDITTWKGQKWFYYNGVNHFSTIDEWLYYEPLVHPVMKLTENVTNILVIGGENGLAIKEVLKYDKVQNVEHLILDTALYQLAKSNGLFTKINRHSLKDHKVTTEKERIFTHLNTHVAAYDVIIVDLPDPVDLELNQYYTREFYELCYQSLAEDGVLVTQAGSPYFATKAYYCISYTMHTAKFSVLTMHNQVLTMGEWGWIIGAKSRSVKALKNKAKSLVFSNIETTWLNNEAMHMMLSFGKVTMNINDSVVNTLKKPVVHTFYTKGTWDF